MSKNSKRRREAIESSIEEMDAEQRRLEQERERDRLDNKKDIARPSLLKRIGSSLLDFVFAGVLAAALFLFSYFVIFPAVGYQDASQRIINYHEESWLFVSKDGKYEELTKHYDEAKTPEQNYDIPITHFYMTNEYAIQNSQSEAYKNRKLASSFYELNTDGEIVRKEGFSANDVTPFLEEEYEKAVLYFYSIPQLNYDYQLTNTTMIISLLIVVSISSLAFYFAIPLIDKRHRTLGYMIGGLVPVRSEDLGEIKWHQVVLRSLIFVVITYISPLTMYILLSNFAFGFIPFFINTAILCFSHSNSGLHDYAVKVNVINKSHSNPFETLKEITGEGEQH